MQINQSSLKRIIREELVKLASKQIVAEAVKFKQDAPYDQVELYKSPYAMEEGDAEEEADVSEGDVACDDEEEDEASD